MPVQLRIKKTKRIKEKLAFHFILLTGKTYNEIVANSDKLVCMQKQQFVLHWPLGQVYSSGFLFWEQMYIFPLIFDHIHALVPLLLVDIGICVLLHFYLVPFVLSLQNKVPQNFILYCNCRMLHMHKGLRM